MAAYYNEIDLYAAQWLRNLIKAGHIAKGEVDTRSIVDVAPDDLRGFSQCHFFAGIAGWSHALRLAGWEDEREIWTGSCPCQPFSVAGKGKGESDHRHLWPHFFRLISSCRPKVVMGEQVAGAAGYGWLDGVRSDLESEGYACEGVDIPACAVNAPHIRQRLYWVSMDNSMRGRHRVENEKVFAGRDSAINAGMGDADIVRELQSQGAIEKQRRWAGDTGDTGGDMADSDAHRRDEGLQSVPRELSERAGGSCFNYGSVGHADMQGSQEHRGSDELHLRQSKQGQAGSVVHTSMGDMGDANSSERKTFDLLTIGNEPGSECIAQPGSCSDMADADNAQRRQNSAGRNDDDRRNAGWEEGSGDNGECCKGAWDDAIWLAGADGKARRAQPGVRLLVTGLPGRVGRLRAYGNAIAPPLAAEVIKAFMESQG